MTTCATSTAALASPERIGSAAREARRTLGRDASYGFVFASPRVDLKAALRAASEAAATPNILGCTTAGEISTHGLAHGGAVVMLVASDVTLQIGAARCAKLPPTKAAGMLLEGLSDTKKKANQREHRHLTSVLLTDGLTGTAERILEAMYDARVQSGVQIVGGAAADESAFSATHVGCHDDASADDAAVLHVFGTRPWGIGVGHGLTPTTKPMRVTKAHDNVVFEINGEPAFSVYQRHAAERGITLTTDNASRYMIEHELGMHFFEKISRARAPLAVGPDGSLRCAAEVPQGSMVSILSGDPSRMVAAAHSAASAAHAQLGGAKTAGVLVFDCVCRGISLGDTFGREVEAIRSVFGDVPLAGFLTYGEIARGPNHLEGWHNSTVVVAAIPE